jgi:hypothetical protein
MEGASDLSSAEGMIYFSCKLLIKRIKLWRAVNGWKLPRWKFDLKLSLITKSTVDFQSTQHQLFHPPTLHGVEKK